MALTPARVGALALIAAAGVATLLLPPEPRRLERGDAYVRTAARVADNAVASARRAVAVRVLRDSVRALGGQASVDRIRSVFIGVWRPGEQEWLADRVRDIAGEDAGIGSATMVFARDSMLGSFPLLFYAIPRGAADDCVAIYAEPVQRPRPLYRRTAPALLGPCAYYARFGPPGGAVDAWLRHGGVPLAITSPGYPPPVHRPPPSRGRGWVLAALRGELPWWSVDQRLAFPLSLNACLAGHGNGCRDFVTGTRRSDRALRAIDVYQESAWIVESGTATYLSDVLTEIGPERFTSLWRADGTLEEAFANAVGTHLGTWTRAWATERLGPGPGSSWISFAALGTSFTAAAVFLAIAALVATRRRVH
jgi:hypothetical protein